ncbi:nucleotidyltransferase [Luteibacter sp. Lutesp34]|uniref:nucleotidyltransferase domain-containing protein n=1 Tax=Luteibacter sp. Lutesp34 TaxID=3243030 RepID=UPI0039B4B61B
MDISRHDPRFLRRESAVGRHLQALTDQLDISDADYDRAKRAYESVAEVVTDSAHPALTGAVIFPQGSFATRTVIRPVDRNDGELDVDLACRLDSDTARMLPTTAMTLVGTQLLTHGRYRDKVQAKTRCWRIQYENAFHLDICPLVRATNGSADAIPDRKSNAWVTTDPQGYAAWFNGLANRLALAERGMHMALDTRAEVAPFPTDVRGKGWLRRTVQLLKRNRDQWAAGQAAGQGDFAPISIILTTLAARVIERHLTRGTQFTSAYDVVRTIVDELPQEIDVRIVNGSLEPWVLSPVAEENFANRWVQDPRWHAGFTAWHASLKATLPTLVAAEGLDTIGRILADAFGSRAASGAIGQAAARLKSGRDQSELAVTKSGLVVAGAVALPKVQPHTFFGARR